MAFAAAGEYGVRARDIWRKAEAAVGAYIRATVLAVVVSSLLLLALFRVAGVPFATILALLGGLSQIVPRLGPVFALLPAVLAALLISPIHALVVLVIGALIHIFIHKYAVRSMQREALKVNPLLQVLLLLALRMSAAVGDDFCAAGGCADSGAVCEYPLHQHPLPSRRKARLISC